MRNRLILVSVFVAVMAMQAYAVVLDAPHNGSSTFVCNDCHSRFSIGSYTDALCNSCHLNDTGGGYSKTNAPKVLTHSSATIANSNPAYGTWQKQCIDCHFHMPNGTHGQLQRIAYGSATYLVTGTVSSIVTNPDGTVTLGYSGIGINSNYPEWSDYSRWGSKSSNQSSGNERGLVFYITPIAATPVASEVVSATSNTLVLAGSPGTVTVGNSFALVYGQYVRSSILGGDGALKNVRFYNNSGVKSFAYDESGTGTDTTPDGVCQVCHTQTAVYRMDGTLAAGAATSHAGRNGVNCVSCHKHEAGFAADCTSCHGQPPVDAGTMVSSPAATGSLVPGAHNKHVNVLGLECATCHYNSAGTGATHNDGTVQAITLGFNINGSQVAAGYDKQAGVDYNTTTGVTFTAGGTMQCSNIYCHSTGQGAAGTALSAGDYKTPAWNGTAVCGSCHKGDGVQGNLTLMDTGSHSTHAGSIQISCSTCHNNAGTGTALHVNNLIEVAFTSDPFATTGSYSQSPNNPGNGYGSCSNVYCHSSVQGANGAGVPASYSMPSWGGTAACGTCHAQTPTTGSHTLHLALYPSCSACHNNAGSNTSKHADRNIDISFSSGSGAYSQIPNTPGNGYGSCSTTNCHGTASPLWGGDTAATQCEKCHGSAATAAAGTFRDTAGLTSGVKVGAHVAHLASTLNYSADIACSACHIVPVNVTDAGHIDTALPAEIKGSLGFLNGTCSTAYCHGAAMPAGSIDGANRTPSWSDAGYLTGTPASDCAQCHGYPPSAILAHNGAGPTSCIVCHDHVNSTGTGFTDVTKHLNGTMDGGADNCSDCHTNASLSATHQKHADANAILAGKKLSLNNYGEAWFYSVSYSSGQPKFGCGYCHPNTVGTHMNGVKNLNIDAGDAAAVGTVKAKNGVPQAYTQASGTSVTCASVYCHSNGYDDGTGYVYQTTPDWYGGAFTGDKCANCHGNSPNSGGKTGSLSHYNPDFMGMGVVGGHFVGIHYKNVFNGTNGLVKDAGNRQNAHGTASTMSTINCNTCHNSTVSVSANDLNTVCTTCHSAANQGTMIIDALSTAHINGTPDVAFAASAINSKAQIRDQITSVAELNNSWNRNSGYKAGAASYDNSTTVSSYNPVNKSCSSVACHNGNTVTWGAINITCNSCHTSLP